MTKEIFEAEYSNRSCGSQGFRIGGTITDGLSTAIGRGVEIRFDNDDAKTIAVWIAEHLGVDSPTSHNQYKRKLAAAETLMSWAKKLIDEADALPEYQKPRN